MCRVLGCVLSVASLLVCIANAAGAERTWTNVKGQTMRAEFVRESGGDVTFLKEGKLVTVALADLSEKDRQVVQDLAAGKSVADEPAPPPANAVTPPPAIADPPPQPEVNPATPQPTGGAKKPLPIVSRLWTDKFGNQTKAKFVRMFDGKVVLSQSSNNKTITLAFYELIDEDQNHVRALLTSRGQEGLIPLPPLVAQAPAEGSPPAPPAVPSFTPPPPFTPPSFSPPSLPPPPVPGSGSSLMEEMRQRREQQLEEMKQRREQMQQEQAQRMADARQKAEEVLERARQEAEERRQNETIGECLSCKGKLTRTQTEMETCPHCGVKWDFEIDAFGHKRPIFKTTTVANSPNSPGPAAARPSKVDPAVVARISRFIVLGVVAVGLLLVMAVVVVVGISIIAASGSKPKQKFY